MDMTPEIDQARIDQAVAEPAAVEPVAAERAAADLAAGALPRLPPSTLVVTADVAGLQRQRFAFTDLAEGLALWRLGFALGWLDIKLKYRGSMLGPFWLTISTAVQIGAMGGIYGTLFHMDLHNYLPFLALSLVLWAALSGLVADGCNTFLQAEATIRSLRMPFFVHALRVVVRTVIGFAHNIPVILAIFAIFGAWPGWAVLGCLPGLVLWTVDAFAVCLVLGTFCARFRDIPPIVGSIMQIAFFVTPIVWKPEQLGRKGWWLPLNPFDSLLEVVRAPLLGHMASGFVWSLAVLFSVMLCTATWVVFARVRSRLAYWV
jgi:lipopolysaccharide transport system permease protein